MKFANGLRVHVSKSFDAFETQIRIIHYANGRTYVAKTMVLEFEDVGDQSGLIALPEPSIRVPGNISDEFMKAFVDAADDLGIPKPSEQRNEGKLEAMEKHLEDMRRLVFKKS